MNGSFIDNDTRALHICIMLSRTALAVTLCASPVFSGPSASTGTLFVSFDIRNPGGAASYRLKGPLASVTLHDSGQTTGPLPLDQSAETAEPSRLSFSAHDHAVVVVLAATVSSIDPGAGRPVALLKQARVPSPNTRQPFLLAPRSPNLHPRAWCFTLSHPVACRSP